MHSVEKILFLELLPTHFKNSEIVYSYYYYLQYITCIYHSTVTYQLLLITNKTRKLKCRANKNNLKSLKMRFDN